MKPDQQPFHFIRNRFGDEVLYEVNRGIFDKLGAATLFHQQYADLFSLPNTLFVVIGTDSGLLPQWIATQERSRGSRFVFVELPEVIDIVRTGVGRSMDDNGFALTTAECWQDLAEEYHFSDYAFLDNFKVVTSLAARDANLPAYRLVETEVTRRADEFKRNIQLQLGSQAFIRRQIQNIPDNRIPAQLLRNQAPTETAVLLGGGPSLDEFLPWVEQHRNGLTLIAVSRIARRLLDCNIRPDIVVSIDPHDVSFDVSKESLLFDNRPPLVCGNHVSPLLLGQWPGPVLYRGDRFPWPSENNGDNLAMAGPTVTNTALATAVDMGFSRVILAGVDLCFSPEGHTHASGSNEREAGPRLGVVGQQVITNDGRLADTDPPFAQAVKIMAEQAGKAAEQDCRIINPAPGAARIELVDHIPLSELEAPESSTPGAQEQLARLLNDISNDTAHAIQVGRKELAWARNQLQDILKLTNDALNANERLFNDEDDSHDFRYKKRMDKIERKLDRQYKKITPMLKSFAAAGFLSLIRPNHEDDWTDEEIRTWGSRYYEIYRDAATELLGLIDAAQRRSTARAQELSPSPDLELLLRQWQIDNHPARAIHFSRQHPEIVEQGGPRILREFRMMAEKFEQVLAEKQTPQAQSLQHSHSLEPVRSKLLVMFRQENREELARLAENLDRLEETTASELAALARGYLSELDDDAASAMANYQVVLDMVAGQLDQEQAPVSNARLEDALRQMCSLALRQENIQTALMSLDALSALSPAYEPQYAELLRLTGQIQDAVNVYTDYMQKVPSDLATMMKLGNMLHEAGADEAAHQAYSYIIERSPENHAAREMLDAMDSGGSAA